MIHLEMSITKTDEIEEAEITELQGMFTEDLTEEHLWDMIDSEESGVLEMYLLITTDLEELSGQVQYI